MAEAIPFVGIYVGESADTRFPTVVQDFSGHSRVPSAHWEMSNNGSWFLDKTGTSERPFFTSRGSRIWLERLISWGKAWHPFILRLLDVVPFKIPLTSGLIIAPLFRQLQKMWGSSFPIQGTSRRAISFM